MKNTEQKNIVFVTNSMRRGGVERVVSVLANHYAKKGYAVSILLLLFPGCEYHLDERVQIIDLSDTSSSRIRQLPKWIRGIRKIVLQKRPQAVISLVGRTNVVMLFSCLFLRQNTVVAEGSDPIYDGRTRFSRFLCKIFYLAARKVVFQTSYQQAFFKRFTRKNSVLIQNPIEALSPGTPGSENIIVAVGNLNPAKNHQMLIRAFQRIAAVDQEVRLVIYGEGELRASLERLIEELSLQGRVLLPGSVTDVHARISNAKCFVHCSSYEGLPNALMEAMTLGLACISTNWNGSDDLIQNGINGLIVPLSDWNALAAAILRVLTERDLADRLQEAARQSAGAFSRDRVLAQWDSIIER